MYVHTAALLQAANVWDAYTFKHPCGLLIGKTADDGRPIITQVLGYDLLRLKDATRLQRRISQPLATLSSQYRCWGWFVAAEVQAEELFARHPDFEYGLLIDPRLVLTPTEFHPEGAPSVGAASTLSSPRICSVGSLPTATSSSDALLRKIAGELSGGTLDERIRPFLRCFQKGQSKPIEINIQSDFSTSMALRCLYGNHTRLNLSSSISQQFPDRMRDPDELSNALEIGIHTRKIASQQFLESASAYVKKLMDETDELGVFSNSHIRPEVLRSLELTRRVIQQQSERESPDELTTDVIKMLQMTLKLVQLTTSGRVELLDKLNS